ncbi:MAG: transposase family protein [Saprospiraceae bacterium]|nr:transposase family protein [Candidatus Brachybacter algidus]
MSEKSATSTKTSDGKGKKTYPNLTNGLVLNGINQLIVGDITTYGRWNMAFYFCLKDVYSQFILCLLPSKNMKAEQAVASLKRCISIRGAQNLKFAIHHTDNGSQYEALIYLMLLNELGMQISRSKSVKENGIAEQLNDNVKNRYLIP